MGCTRLLLVCALLLSACGEPPDRAPDAPPEWVRPYDGHVPEDQPHPTAVFLVVDAQTGRPIEGAAVRHHYEIDVGPEGWAPLVQEARTDRFGLVTMEVPRADWIGGFPRDGHWAIHAEGYAATEEYGNAPATRVELVPARTRHGRLVDALGRPLAGIRVGYKEGCAHAPFLAATVTDAEGVFVISGIVGGGELYYRAPGALAAYFGGPLRHVDETPYTHAAAPARRIRGRVRGFPLDTLAPRMLVAAADARGAFARVEADGAFVLDGGDAEGLLTLYYGPEGAPRELALGDVRPGGPFVWDLALGDRDPTESDVVAPRTLLVHVHGPGGEPVPAGTVAAYRVEDGRLQDGADFDPDAPAGVPYTLELLPGAYDVVVGRDGEQWHADPVRVTVGRDPPAPITIGAHAHARLAIAWRGIAEGAARSWQFAYAGPEGRIDHVELDKYDEEQLFVPPDAVARLAVEVEGMTRFFDVGPLQDGRRLAVVDWPPPRTIRFTSEAEPADAELGGLDHEVRATAEGYTLRTHLEGRLRLRIWPRIDGFRGPRPLEVRVDLTGPTDTGIDLGALAWPGREPGRLTLRDAEGAPLADVDVEVRALDLAGTGHPIEYDHARTDEQGVLASRLLMAGAWIAFQHPTTLRSYRRPIEGDGPWTVRLGPCAIALEVHGPYGILLDAHVLVDGVARGRDGDVDDDPGSARFTLTGLEPGPHELVITAPDHRGQAHRVVLAPGETRTIRATLQPRR